MNCKFVVSFSKEHLFLTVPLFSLMAAGGINRCVRNNYMPTYIIAVVIVLAIMAADLLTTLCFSAKMYNLRRLLLEKVNGCREMRKSRKGFTVEYPKITVFCALGLTAMLFALTLPMLITMEPEKGIY